MGNFDSKHGTSCDSGTLLGASPSGVSKPPPLRGFEKFMIKIPADKKSGDKLKINIRGRFVDITIPRGVVDNRLLRGGDQFEVSTPGDRNKVIASTLHTLPGLTIVECKPMIFASVTSSFTYIMQYTHAADVGKSVTALLQQCQAELLERTMAVGCNAVLGVSNTVANDSSGETGTRKVIIVTMTGTPCIVVSDHSRQSLPTRLQPTAPTATATATAIGTSSANAAGHSNNNIPILAEAVVLPPLSKNDDDDDDFETRC
jgi:hypothetical protein